MIYTNGGGGETVPQQKFLHTHLFFENEGDVIYVKNPVICYNSLFFNSAEDKTGKTSTNPENMQK